MVFLLTLVTGSPSSILDNIDFTELQDTIRVTSKQMNFRLSKRRASFSDADSQKEISATGSVSKKVYLRYWRSVGPCLGLFIIVLVAAMQVELRSLNFIRCFQFRKLITSVFQISKIGVDWWLSVWVTVKTDRPTNITDFYYLNSIENGKLICFPFSNFLKINDIIS